MKTLPILNDGQVVLFGIKLFVPFEVEICRYKSYDTQKARNSGERYYPPACHVRKNQLYDLEFSR